ncbi:hypothetical protein J437_LFUL009962 [Ladona fulva]|uniref:Uncharacterized protein n=1 Tax=Ladona fulva TaxID=123851 RepID=A0A8K0P733_LADFU|nr:hypothetical protein J437_LFUL009962 [Ladona fulva]
MSQPVDQPGWLPPYPPPVQHYMQPSPYVQHPLPLPQPYVYYEQPVPVYIPPYPPPAHIPPPNTTPAYSTTNFCSTSASTSAIFCGSSAAGQSTSTIIHQESTTVLSRNTSPQREGSISSRSSSRSSSIGSRRREWRRSSRHSPERYRERRRVEMRYHRRSRELSSPSSGRSISREQSIDSEVTTISHDERGHSQSRRHVSVKKDILRHHHRLDTKHSASRSGSSRDGNSSKSESKELIVKKEVKTERDEVNEHLENWRKGMGNNMSLGGPRTNEEMGQAERCYWTRAAPAELYYARDEQNPRVMKATKKLLSLSERFENELVARAERARAVLPKLEDTVPSARQLRLRVHKVGGGSHSSSSSDDGSSSEDVEEEEEDRAMEELQRKRMHPHRLHPELWYNDTGEV